MKLTALLDNSGQMERVGKKDKMDKRELKVRLGLLGRPEKMEKAVKVTMFIESLKIIKFSLIN